MNNGEQFFNTAAGGGYAISRSLRFNSSDSAYLSRVFGTPTDAKKQTYSFWIKRSNLGQIGGFERAITNAYTGGSTATGIYLYNDSIQVTVTNAGDNVRSTALFRDVSAWYHFVVSVDTTQATAANRVRIYVNGAEITQFASASYPAQNSVTQFANSSTSRIGTLFNAGGYWYDGLIAEFHFIDGQALTPTSFGEFSATTGVWVPKRYTGTYGTNGFRLDFSDNSAATATTLGKDAAGSNNWTPNNFSVTAGADNDSLVDVPTNGSEVDTGLGGQVRGNYCTWNPLDSTAGHTLSNGNLDVVPTTMAWKHTRSTISIPTSDKWYAEFTFPGLNDTQFTIIGFAPPSLSLSTYVGAATGSIGFQCNATVWTNGGSGLTGTTYAANDIMQIAVDRASGKAWLGKNGTWISSGNPANGTNPTTSSVATTGDLFFAVSIYATGNSVVCNWGARPFAYTAPSGFKALCTANLPAPLVTKPSSVFDVVTYTGTGSSLTPTSSLGFNPDLVWIKSRSAATDHSLYDSVRGAQARLESNTTDAEVTSDNGLTAFNSNGFTLGTLAQVNTNAATYAGWCWDAGSSTVTNTAGSITSSVRANASAGFSIVTYTGTLTSAGNVTIGHGLGVAPSLIITKSRSDSSRWAVFPSAALGANKYLELNTTAAVADSVAVGGGAAPVPTSTVFYTPYLFGANVNGQTFFAYCFAPVAGYSSFGSYTGDSAPNFIYTGFTPALVIMKRTDTGDEGWLMTTWKTQGYNSFGAYLGAHSSSAEATTTNYMDIVSNGFVHRHNSGWNNASGGTYIYAAFAEAPFQYALAR
jgi:hypothetical protein